MLSVKLKVVASEKIYLFCLLNVETNIGLIVYVWLKCSFCKFTMSYLILSKLQWIQTFIKWLNATCK